MKKLNYYYLCFLFAAIVSLSAQCFVVSEPQVPCLFIFGDSTVDSGNNNFRHTTSRADFSPYGIDFPEGPTGRFTNGRTIVDVVAELLGFKKYIPRFANVPDEDVIGGVNYGSGGAGIVDETGRILGEVISFNEQLSNHKATFSRVAKILGGSIAARRHLRKCIYYVGLGNNDYLLNYLPKFYSSNASSTPEEYATHLISQYSKQLRKLFNYGARKVAVFGVGKVGCVPHHISTYGATDGSSCVHTSNDVASLFNQKLQRLIYSLNDCLPGATFIHINTTSNASFGNITNLRNPCCVVSNTDGSCIAGRVPCNNRNEYYFWDAIHPSEAANLRTGEIAYINMSPLYSMADDQLVEEWCENMISLEPSTLSLRSLFEDK